MNIKVSSAVALLFLGFAMNGQAQTPLQDMVKTEQAFSKMAEEKTAREAFMAYIADEGLLFRPGAVNGKKWMLEHPVPPSDKRPLLAWQPNYAQMAISGDMGFTTGPWEFKGDIKDAKPSGYGHFVTVWKKQGDSSWKWVVDIGISHPQSGGPQTLWHPTMRLPEMIFKSPEVGAKALKSLLDRDRNFSTVSVEHGLARAFNAFSEYDIRLYRNGGLPFIGREASVGALSSVTGQFKSEPISGDVSSVGDFGYTHGTYDLTDETKVIEHGSYVRIWRKVDYRWKIVLDITNAH